MKKAIEQLTKALASNDDDAAKAAVAGLVQGWADLQERQAAAMERVAAALEAQSKLLEMAVSKNPTTT